MDKSTTNTLTHRISSFWPKAIFIFLASVLLNINTLKNTHALDDEMVINRNVYMHMGFSGIKTILTNDSYQGFLDDMGAKNPLSGLLSIYFLAFTDAACRFLNLSTRPAASITFSLPVKNGWQSLQISTLISL